MVLDVEHNTMRKENNKILGPDLAARYRIIKKLGEGGMGEVYLAEDEDLHRKVAIKFIRSDLQKNKKILKRIKQECRLHAAIGVHPNIVALYDKKEENGNLYLVMEYVDGIPLSRFILKKKEMDQVDYIKAVCKIIIQLLDALSCIHRLNIIHRDIKPSNILINSLAKNNFQAKLMDFGIACLESGEQGLTRLTTINSSSPGTPEYMAPECIDPATFGEPSPATDIYSVGIILYELLSGNLPFSGTITQVFTGHLTKAPEIDFLQPLGIPPSLIFILKRSLEKRPEKRYQEATMMAMDIKATLNNFNSEKESFQKTIIANNINISLNKKTNSTLLDAKQSHRSSKQNFIKKWAILGGILLLFVTGFIFWRKPLHSNKNLKDLSATQLAKSSKDIKEESKKNNSSKPKTSKVSESSGEPYKPPDNTMLWEKATPPDINQCSRSSDHLWPPEPPPDINSDKSAEQIVVEGIKMQKKINKKRKSDLERNKAAWRAIHGYRF